MPANARPRQGLAEVTTLVRTPKYMTAWSELTMRTTSELGESARCAGGGAVVRSWLAHTTAGGRHGHIRSSDSLARAQRRAPRHDRHRRRPGGPVRRVLPAEERRGLRHPRRQRADRRLVADAHVGLAPPVHPRPLRRAAGLAVPGTGL